VRGDDGLDAIGKRNGLVTTTRMGSLSPHLTSRCFVFSPTHLIASTSILVDIPPTIAITCVLATIQNAHSPYQPQYHPLHHQHVNTLPPPPTAPSNAHLPRPALNSTLYHPRSHAIAPGKRSRDFQIDYRTAAPKERTCARLARDGDVCALRAASRERWIWNFAGSWRRCEVEEGRCGVWTLESCEGEE